MASDTILTDDYVAELLAKEASEASIKYSTMGLDAFKTTKMPANKAKPNKRFLNRIIKETTSHNAALLAKEAAEAQARLDDLAEAEEKKRRKFRPSPDDIRRRQLGDISSILLGKKRKPKPDEEDSRQGSKAGGATPEKERSSGRHRRWKRDDARHEHDEADKYSKDRCHTRDHRDDDRDSRKHRQRSHSPECPSSRRKYRQRSPLSDDDSKSARRHHSSKHRSGGSRSGGDPLRDALSSRRRDGRAAGDHPSSSHSRSAHRSPLDEEEEVAADSDPLEDLIGPAPPPQASPSAIRPRGRGAIGGKLAMDNHFSDSYDPRSESNGEAGPLDDWDDVVEAFRDRQKWKQQGAERLRTAGFTEEQIKKWENQAPGGEKDLEDVRWSKKGEKREWDRGKKGFEED